ncbi:hypothetical protein [Desulfovibrio falkowii]|uniref:hypothetical protein n=1 Tax=Desulfovibrio sp. WGS1351 TaxID=3366814 RepID=UPI00372CFC2D
MPEIKFDPSRVIPTAPINPPRRLGVGIIGSGELLGVGDVCCSCRRAIAGCIKTVKVKDTKEQGDNDGHSS